MPEKLHKVRRDPAARVAKAIDLDPITKALVAEIYDLTNRVLALEGKPAGQPADTAARIKARGK